MSLCRFFTTPQGCFKGDKCNFKHIAAVLADTAGFEEIKEKKDKLCLDCKEPIVRFGPKPVRRCKLCYLGFKTKIKDALTKATVAAAAPAEKKTEKKTTPCYICQVPFSTDRYIRHGWYVHCDDCDNIKRQIQKFGCEEDSFHEFDFDSIPGEFYPNLFMKITYDVNNGTHSGYCSDSYDVRYTKTETTMIYPLLRTFKKADMKDLSNSYSMKMKYYAKDKESHGYCGVETTYDIAKAQIIKKEDVVSMLLDD